MEKASGRVGREEGEEGTPTVAEEYWRRIKGGLEDEGAEDLDMI